VGAAALRLVRPEPGRGDRHRLQHWGGRQSGYVYTLTRRPDGLTDVDEVLVRDGKTLRGRLIGFAIGTVAK
jgi:hypothetical protein